MIYFLLNIEQGQPDDSANALYEDILTFAHLIEKKEYSKQTRVISNALTAEGFQFIL